MQSSSTPRQPKGRALLHTIRNAVHAAIHRDQRATTPTGACTSATLTTSPVVALVEARTRSSYRGRTQRAPRLTPAAAPAPLTKRVLLQFCAIGALCLSFASTAFGAECPNEQYRHDSESTRLPDCRAYELVSPANAGFPVESVPIAFRAESKVPQGSGTLGPNLIPEGNLAAQLGGPIDVQDGGSAVFWMMNGAVAGTGAAENGGDANSYRSMRTADGWSSRDLLASAAQPPEQESPKFAFLGASEDGSEVLIVTNRPLGSDASAFANPSEAELGEWAGDLVYRVNADGASAPQLISHGITPIPANASGRGVGTPFAVSSVTPELSEVTFKSLFSLEPSDACNTVSGNLANATTYEWNENAAFNGLTFPRQLLSPVELESGEKCEAELPVIASVPAILSSGQAIVMPTSGTGLPAGPLEAARQDVGGVENVLVALAGVSGGTFLAAPPNGSDVYLQATGALDPQYPGARTGQIYVDGPVREAKVTSTCLSCATDQEDVTYIGMSGDGQHLLFTTGGREPGLWEWSQSTGAQLLTHASDIAAGDAVASTNGEYVVIVTSKDLAAPAQSDIDGGPDLYELSAGRAPVLVTSGASTANYDLTRNEGFTGPLFTPVSGVSDSGKRVVYEAESAGVPSPPTVIAEWDDGQTAQISPSGSSHSYHVAAIVGDELENAFFLAEEPLVPWDDNDGVADVYDARAEGGFQPCTEGDPLPPSGQSSCGKPTSTPDPQPPSQTGFGANLASPATPVAGLPPDTSVPLDASRPAGEIKSLTRPQKLAKALKACHHDNKRAKRKACERTARAKYGPRKAKKK